MAMVYTYHRTKLSTDTKAMYNYILFAIFIFEYLNKQLFNYCAKINE